ncbi:nicotinamidase [Trichlorobacter ammonificans]|uniref:nicotinamidase n=1 Tax=Trichlorobacter ammonificans TaxID=2916410 RepID=A0ABM9D841_9BACT|nr:nicotinamidase [Trichlorobacter ammonificans]CAH2031383.1 Nicotinamidase [Trichlorobacter ammonificans]
MELNAVLLLVDLQNDFCPGGALQIPEGDRVIGPVNRLLRWAVTSGLPVLATRDWHPSMTGHFTKFGGIWPVHCVQGTPGAAFHPGLLLPEGAVVLSKGTDPERDGYSAFEAATADGRVLRELLDGIGAHRLYIAGLATDYCVRTTVLEALREGFSVTVLTDAVAGVDRTPGASARALAEVERGGARLMTVDDLLREERGHEEIAPSG